MSSVRVRRCRGPVPPVLSVLALLVLAGGACPPAAAYPTADGLELYGGSQATGPVASFHLAPDEHQRVCKAPFRIASLLTGDKVGVLLQRPRKSSQSPQYAVMTGKVFQLPGSFANQTDEVVLFRKGPPMGPFPYGHPYGAALSEGESRTIVGGVNPETPNEFYPVGTKGNFVWIPDRDMRWLQVYGKSTYVKFRDSLGQERTYTTKGQESHEVYFYWDFKYYPVTYIEVGTQSAGGSQPFAVAPPADARARWVHPDVTFRLHAGGRWIEYQKGQPVHPYQEAMRTAAHVEILDPGRNVRVRLYANGLGVLAPGPGGAYAPAYAGGGWRDARDYWLAGPGHAFRQTSGSAWEELQNGRTAFTFTENQRTPELVELLDASRGIAVRLQADRALILRKADPNAAWQVLGPGHWEREPAPPIAMAPTLLPAQPLPAATPAAPSSAPSIAGTWVGGQGTVYVVQQSGATFTWTSPSRPGFKAQGRFTSATTLAVQWSGPQGSGSAQGAITATGASGKPTRITWSNGIVFTRP